MKVNDECNWLDFYFRQMLSLWWSQGIIFRFGILRDHVSSLDGDISVLLHHHHVYHIWMAIGRISIWWFNTMADGNQDRTGLRTGKTWSDHHQVISNPPLWSDQWSVTISAIICNSTCLPISTSGLKPRTRRGWGQPPSWPSPTGRTRLLFFQPIFFGLFVGLKQDWFVKAC